MEITWIEDFLALSELGNFTAAARRRATTQSAFSRRIQQLEDWLGAPLFVRTSRPTALTQAGIDFAARAAQLRDDMIDARRAVTARRSHYEQAARIYTTNTLAATVLPGWLEDAGLGRYSIVVASVAGCLEALRQHRGDHALLPWFDTDLPVDLDAKRIARDQLSLMATQDCAAGIKLARGKLTGPLLAYTPGTLSGSRISELLESRSIRTDVPVCESASAEALLALAQAGLGAAWLPGVLARNARNLVPLLPSLDIGYGIVHMRQMADIPLAAAR